MLVIGLFFSVHFAQNSPVAVSADKKTVSAPSRTENKVVLPKTALFKFDPMEKVRGSVENIELEKQREQNEQVMKKKQADGPKNPQEQKYRSLIADSPLKEMLPFIAECDEETAAFLIAIAKKESDFGKHSPKKGGRDCFNYWGYRGIYNQTASGYSCFDSPEQAVEVVGGRIRELIEKKINTAEKMVVWKCGSTCAGHDPVSVRKWISDVALYYGKVRT